jgi:hypoxanthine phosphoribosyltransferase
VPEILHIDPDQLVLDSFRLGRAVFETGFRPKHMISVWRGGTPIGLGVDAYFRFQGQQIHHTSLATQSYHGIGKQSDVVVKGLEHLVRSVCPEDGLLIIDDVYERGETIRGIVEGLRRRARRNAPADIRVATVHRKREKHTYTELPVVSLHDLPGDVWIDYPHELADLVDRDDPDDALIRAKSPAIWDILHGRDGGAAPQAGGTCRYLPAREILLDSIRLGVQMVRSGYRPDFLVALWPGGVWAGLGIHEVYKYFARKEGWTWAGPDHVPVNTTRTHLSYRTHVIGLDYLAEHVEHEHSVLLVDTVFRSGRTHADLVNGLKDLARRNLSLSRLKVASIYFTPSDSRTWTVQPFRIEPDFYLRCVSEELIYPHAPYRFVSPRQQLAEHAPALAEVLFG